MQRSGIDRVRGMIVIHPNPKSHSHPHPLPGRERELARFNPPGHARYNGGMAIRQLSPLLVNQIAAGEVIERPASVVKELVENALDAGAGRIEVRIEEGGRKLIRVSDDGGGIAAEELPLALSSHATSKIAEPDDLLGITTMGFRGEALASLASVAQVRLTSRAAGCEAGAVIEAAGDQRSAPQPTGCAPGTVVEARNLFFNTPARRKFLRGESTEFGHISELIGRLAMAHPRVAFTLDHNDRRSIDLPPTDSRARRCLDVLGNDLGEAVLELESDEAGIGLWGLAGLPSIARATAKYQYLYVNARPIRDRRIAHAVKEAYRGLIDPSRQPVVVLFIEIDPREVDFNVHPAKSEVRFTDANRAYGQVLAAIRQRLLQSDLTPSVSLSSGSPGLSLDSLRGDGGAAGPQGTFDLGRPGDSPGEPSTDRQAVDRFVDYFRRMDPTQKGFAYQQVKQAFDEAADGPDGEALTEPIRPSTRPILQVHDSYIVTQDETGLVIVDQHALHERVMFATLLERIRSHGKLESQRLLTPAVFDVDPSRMEALEELAELMDKLGIVAEPMGPASVAVHGFPTLLFDRRVEPGEFVHELIDKTDDDQINPNDEAALHAVLDMMSCKAAIKAGDTMSEQELGDLLSTLDRVERSSNCPHGRPTTIRLTLGELEKHFKRT